MFRIIAIIIAVALSPTTADAAGEIAGLPVAWSLDSVGGGAVGRVQLTLETRSGDGRSTVSNVVALAELAGLAPAQFGAPRGGPVRFRMRREAGTLDCSGTVGSRRGRGQCRFSADPAFAQALARRRIDRPSPRQAFHLWASGHGLDLVDELRRQGYATPTIDELVGAAIMGISPSYVRDLAQSGYRLGRVDRLIGFRIHGASAGWLRALAAANPRLARAPPDAIIAMRIHGVSPEWAGELAKLGYGDLSSNQVVAMRIHGVSPQFVRETMAATGRRPSADELIAMRILGPRAPRRR